MPEERTNERLARWIVQTVLGCPVVRHEDGQRDSQVDAEIVMPGRRVGLEIVSDQDPILNSQLAALTKVNHRLHVPGLQQRWAVTIGRRARVNDLRGALPPLMLRLERGEIDWPRRTKAPDEFARLGVSSAWPSTSQSSGIVDLFIEGWGGWEGNQLNPWLDEMFSRHADVPRKLAAHPTADGHAFVWVTVSTDYSVQSCLEDRGQGTPVDTPSLPDGITHLWVASTLSSQGVLAWFPHRGWWRTPWVWKGKPPVLPDDF